LYVVPLLTEEVNGDIRLHVRRFIESNRHLKNWSQELRTEIEESISGGAQGMSVPFSTLSHLVCVLISSSKVSIGGMPVRSG
jgi:hypothetical protein